MTVSNKISDFLSYWCQFKCPYKDCKVFEDDNPIDVDVDDCQVKCICPKCGEEFNETVDGSDIDYETYDKYDFPEKYCECCQVEKFVEELIHEL